MASQSARPPRSFDTAAGDALPARGEGPGPRDRGTTVEAGRRVTGLPGDRGLLSKGRTITRTTGSSWRPTGALTPSRL